MKKVYVFASVTAVAVGGLFVGCSNSKTASTTTTTTTIPVPASVQSALGSAYTIAVFAQVPGTLQPDDMVVENGSIFVVCQDPNINPDGTLMPGVNSAQSQVLEYDNKGNVMQTFNVPGHPDGIVAYDATTVWVSSNEDANPIITAINTTANTLQSYTSDVAALPHGGGLDDLKVANGVAYASGSNPTTTFSPSPSLGPYSTDGNGATAEFGVNVGPVLYTISLNSDGKTFHSTPVLTSSTSAMLLPGNTPVTLNMTDSDSSAVDPSGNFVETSQQDSELVFIKNIGTATQSVSVLPLTLYGNPWPVDDTRWSPATGTSVLLLSDPPTQLIYQISSTAGFTPNTPYSAGQGTLLQTDTTTGNMTPVYVGMNNPHGLIFVPTN